MRKFPHILNQLLLMVTSSVTLVSIKNIDVMLQVHWSYLNFTSFFPEGPFSYPGHPVIFSHYVSWPPPLRESSLVFLCFLWLWIPYMLGLYLHLLIHPSDPSTHPRGVRPHARHQELTNASGEAPDLKQLTDEEISKKQTPKSES